MDEAVDIVLQEARITNPNCVWAGISVNTSGLSDDERNAYLADLESQYKLPCVDPVATGMARIADQLLGHVK